MERFLLTSILLISITIGAQAENKKTVPSKLNEATVFFRGAELKHSATATLTKGENELWIEGLSPNIDASSLKVGVSGGVTVSSYEYVNNYKDGEILNPAAKKLLDSLNIYEKKAQQLDIDTKVCKQMGSLLEKGMTQKFAATDKSSSLDELMKSMDYFRTKSTDIENVLAKNAEEKKHCDEAIARINNELEQMGRNAGALKLNINAPDATNSQITISYCTYNASWAPYYSINVVSIDQPIQIISKAKVMQNTGIDWQRVKLTLSTGMPNNGKVAPIFQTWFLRERQVMARNNGVQNSYTAIRPETKMMAETADEMIQPSTLNDYLTVDDNALVMTYSIDLPYTIPGNGKAQNIDLRTQQANANYHYYCAPRLNGETFLLAELTDGNKLDMLSGNAQITYDGMYLGNTYINSNSTLKNLTLTLGTDKRISVKREKMQDFSSKKSFGSMILQVFTYKITVKNNQKKAVKMTLKDQYPTPTQKDIEVELQKETTKPTSDNKETGVLTWEDTLQPGETRTYQFSYSVKYPKDLNLNL